MMAVDDTFEYQTIKLLRWSLTPENTRQGYTKR